MFNLSHPNRHYIGREVVGKKCAICGADATHKISEEMTGDDPMIYCRPVHAAYVCCEHFRMIMGSDVACPVDKKPESGVLNYITNLIKKKR